MRNSPIALATLCNLCFTPDTCRSPSLRLFDLKVASHRRHKYHQIPTVVARLDQSNLGPWSTPLRPFEFLANLILSNPAQRRRLQESQLQGAQGKAMQFGDFWVQFSELIRALWDANKNCTKAVKYVAQLGDRFGGADADATMTERIETGYVLFTLTHK